MECHGEFREGQTTRLDRLLGWETGLVGQDFIKRIMGKIGGLLKQAGARQVSFAFKEFLLLAV